MCKFALLFVGALLCLSSTVTRAQDGYFSGWFQRVDKTQAEQPHWITPLATTTPRLEEELRYDQLWQENAKGVTTNNYDGGKGLELIPFEKVEVIFNAPPYIDHNNPADKNGFGDVAFLVKYRLLSANEEGGKLHPDCLPGLEPAHGVLQQRLSTRGHYAYDCLREGIRAF